MIRFSAPIIAIALASSCSTTADRESSDLWCGDELCFWHLERGEVASVPTWVSTDLGIDFVGSDVAIDLVTPFGTDPALDAVVRTPSGSACVVFTVTADVDADADVTLNLDADADGTIDATQRIPTSSWDQVVLETTVVGWVQGMRFELTKRGSGNAVLAALHTGIVSSCGDRAPSVIAPALPLGAACGYVSCGSGAMCASPGYSDLVWVLPAGFDVNGGVCATCGSDADCSSGDVCGAGAPLSPTLDVPHECVPAGQTLLGEPCWTTEECDTGFCAFDENDVGSPGVCSGCRSDTDCRAEIGGSSDERCSPRDESYESYEPFGVTPKICNPGLGTSGSGAWCFGGSDCASGVCDGVMIGQCEGDYRACTSDEDCWGERLPVSRHPCVPDQIVGGTCR